MEFVNDVSALSAAWRAKYPRGWGRDRSAFRTSIDALFQSRFGGLSNSNTGPKIVKFEESLKVMNALHCVHCMIWCPTTEDLILDRYPSRAAVLMQMRFDGKLGFPGGMIDEDICGMDFALAQKNVVDALNRELKEEANLDQRTVFVTEKDYCYTQLNKRKTDLFCHFFTLEVTKRQFVEIEHSALNAADFGDEVMGHIRVPLYTMEDEDRGFPAFIRNNFVGPALSQLFVGLYMNELFRMKELYELDAMNAIYWQKFVSDTGKIHVLAAPKDVDPWVLKDSAEDF